MKKTKWKKGLLTGTLVLLALLTHTACGASEDVATNTGGQMNSPMAEEFNYEMADDSLGMDMYASESKTESGSGGQQQKPDADSPSSNRKLIRTVRMSVETKEFDSVMETLEKRVDELGGYIEDMETYNGSVYNSSRSSRSASMTARIPAAQLNVFLGEVSDISNVTRRSENVQDVTLDYVDLDSHKKTLQAEHERLLELMERAEYIEDIITIEQRLSEVRYQIESMEARLRTYDNKVDYGTVYLDVSEVKELTPVHEETVWERISGGFIENLQGVGNGALEIVIWVLIHIPTLVLWALFLFLFILWLRWWMKRDREKAKVRQAQAAAGPRQGGFNPGAPNPGGFNPGAPNPGGLYPGGPNPGGPNPGAPDQGGRGDSTHV